MDVYTDGSALWSDGSAGMGIVNVIDDNRFFAAFHTLPPYTTVQQAELLAVVRALKNKLLEYPVTVYSDSEYVVKGMNFYAQTWLTTELHKYGITTFKNDTVPELYRLLRSTIGTETKLELTGSSDEVLKNLDIWEMLWQQLLKVGQVEFVHIKGHSGIWWNELADMLASHARERSYDQYGLIKLNSRRI